MTEVLTAEQRDALAEVINISFSCAAASLSELTSRRVELYPPEVRVYPVAMLGAALQALAATDIATVHQVFQGPVAGDALLVLSREDARSLARLLVGLADRPASLTTGDRDVLTELGNILLGACLGTFGNLLQVRVSFTVPSLRLDSLSALLQSLLVDAEELRYGLVLTTRFTVREAAVSGTLIIILGVSSLDQLLSRIATLG